MKLFRKRNEFPSKVNWYADENCPCKFCIKKNAGEYIGIVSNTEYLDVWTEHNIYMCAKYGE